jgi:hypothetical protein
MDVERNVTKDGMLNVMVRTYRKNGAADISVNL